MSFILPPTSFLLGLCAHACHITLNVRYIQFLNVVVGEEIERYTFLEFKMHLSFSMEKMRKVSMLYSK
jgi:hypothetical protein